MRLKYGELRNFRQHDELAVNVTGNLVGIVGPNGHGKSNLLASIQWALTGDVPGVTREKLLRWGATEGYALWQFEHNGNEITVCRGVGEGPTWIKVNDGKKTQGITKVNQVLMDVAGLDKDVGRTIFVQQKMLDQVLFDLPSKREQAFQRLCGMGDAAKINRDLGNFIATRLQDMPDFALQIAEMQRQRTEAEVSIEAAQTQLNGLLASAPAEPSSQLQARAAQYDVAIPCLTRISEQSTNAARLQAAVSPIETEIAALKQDGADTPLKLLDDEIAKLRLVVTKAAAYEKAHNDLVAAQAAAQALGEPPATAEQLAALREQRDAVMAAAAQTSSRLAMYKQLLQALGSPAVVLTNCPVCGSAIQDKQQAINHLNQLVAGEQTAWSDVNPKCSAAETSVLRMQTAIQSHLTQQSAVSQRVQMTQAALANLQMSGDLAQVKTQAAGAAAEIATVTSLRDDIATKQQRLTLLTGQLTATLSQLATSRQAQTQAIQQFNQFVAGLITGHIGDLTDMAEVNRCLGLLTEEKTRVQQAIKLWENYSSQSAYVHGQINQLKATCTRIDNTIKELELRRSQQATFVRVTQTLTNVRDFFHYNNGPHKLATSVLVEMNQDLNMFLQKMNAPFSATAQDAGLTYLCQFHDGRPMPAEGYMEATDLSGGEKAMLAIAFRLASYMMFANKQGLLGLDECTAYLDDNNIANFCELLSTLKGVAKSLDLQLLMSTHERSTIPFMDSVIDLKQMKN